MEIELIPRFILSLIFDARIMKSIRFPAINLSIPTHVIILNVTRLIARDQTRSHPPNYLDYYYLDVFVYESKYILAESCCGSPPQIWGGDR